MKFHGNTSRWSLKHKHKVHFQTIQSLPIQHSTYIHTVINSVKIMAHHPILITRIICKPNTLCDRKLKKLQRHKYYAIMPGAWLIFFVVLPCFLYDGLIFSLISVWNKENHTTIVLTNIQIYRQKCTNIFRWKGKSQNTGSIEDSCT